MKHCGRFGELVFEALIDKADIRTRVLTQNMSVNCITITFTCRTFKIESDREIFVNYIIRDKFKNSHDPSNRWNENNCRGCSVEIPVQNAGVSHCQVCRS